jgi:hypothetical protein
MDHGAGSRHHALTVGARRAAGTWTGGGGRVPMNARLLAALGVRPAEARVLALVAAVFATLEAGRGVGEVGANTLVVSRLSAEALPYLYVPLGIISLVAALATGRRSGASGAPACSRPSWSGSPGCWSPSGSPWRPAPTRPSHCCG